MRKLVVAMVVSFLLLAPLYLQSSEVKAAPVTYNFGPGSLTTTDNNSWGGYSQIAYPVVFNA